MGLRYERELLQDGMTQIVLSRLLPLLFQRQEHQREQIGLKT